MRKAVVLGLVVAVWAGTAGVARADDLPSIGLMVDAGLPDGGTAALVYRPLSFLRLNGGVSHNLVGPGVRGGVTLVALPWWFSPTVSATYGHYFERDANEAARTVSGDDMLDSPALERFGYDYADAHLGFELGRKRATFYLHAGVTRVTGHVRNLDQVGADAEPDDGNASVSFTQDPNVTMTTLSARFGLIVYIL
jgi:hypothetical protein